MKKLFIPCLLLAKCSSLLLAMLLAFTTARAQTPGQLDMSFNPGMGTNGYSIFTSVLQPDGKVIIGGAFNSYYDTPRNRIARVNTDGSLDPTFNPGSGISGLVMAVILQPDGKVIIGGDFNDYNGTFSNNIVRVNADGSLDATFNPGTGVIGGNVYAGVLQPDGKVIIAGKFDEINFITRNNIARLNANGSLDATFDPGLGPNYRITTVALQPDGKVIIGGEFTAYNGTPRNRIARLNANGSLDATFDPGLGLNGEAHTVALQPDGKVIIGGLFTDFNNAPRNSIVRVNANGSLDATFNPGTGLYYSFPGPRVYSVVLQPNGKIIIGGIFTSYNGTSRNHIARLNANGSLDGTFNPGSGADNPIYSAVLQSDGRVIIAGEISEYNGTPRQSIARVFGGELVAAPDLVSSQIGLFPNPTAGRITIDLSELTEPELASVEVYNLLGQTVQRTTITAGAATELNLQGLPEGAYLVRVNLAGKVLTQKVLLQP